MDQKALQRRLTIKIPTGSIEKYSFLFTTMFFLPIINGFLNEIFLVLGIPSISTFVYYLIYILSFYTCFVALLQNYKRTSGLILLVLFFLVYEIVLHPAVAGNLFNFSGGLSSIALSNFFLLFFLGLPMLWIGRCLDVHCLGKIQQYCEAFSYIVVALFFVTMILQFESSYTFNYMTVAYNAMPSLLIMMYCGFEKKRRIAILFFIIGSFFIIIGGCRGALLQLCVAIIAYFFVSGSSVMNTKKIILLLLALFVSLLVYRYFNQIIVFVGRTLNSVGFSSRLVRMLQGTSAEGNILHFDDRAEIYELTIQTVSFLGNGIFVYPPGMGYPHNIALEFILGYGYIIGVILLIGLLSIIIRSYRCARSSDNRFLMIMWVSAFTTIFVKLMLSASYLTDRPFWFYLAFMLYTIRIRREQKYDQVYSQENTLPFF